MKHPLERCSLLIVQLAVLLLAGCSSSGGYRAADIGPYQPAWLGGDYDQLWTGKEDEGFAGVGLAEGGDSLRDLRSRAIGDALTRLRLVMKPSMRLALAGYLDSGAGHKEYGKEPDRERVAADLEQIIDQTASSGRVMDYWLTPRGELFALVAVTEDDFHAGVEKSDRLSAALREHLHEDGKEMFSRIAGKGLGTYLKLAEKMAVKAAL